MRSLLLFSMIVIAAACADSQAGEDLEANDGPAAEVPAAGSTDAGSGAEADTGMIYNTPEGGVLDWAADIDAGLDSVPGLLGTDPAAAQGAVLNLYVMRQEYLEGYYGPGGRLEATPELADAVETNEARFHALMAELAKESPDSATAAALVDSLAAQTARVRAAAEAAGGPLTPWAERG